MLVLPEDYADPYAPSKLRQSSSSSSASRSRGTADTSRTSDNNRGAYSAYHSTPPRSSSIPRGPASPASTPGLRGSPKHLHAPLGAPGAGPSTGTAQGRQLASSPTSFGAPNAPITCSADVSSQLGNSSNSATHAHSPLPHQHASGSRNSLRPSDTASDSVHDGAAQASACESNSLGQADLLDSEDGAPDAIIPQAVDILAGLASLGISDGLRQKVQDALEQLASATESVLPGLDASVAALRQQLAAQDTGGAAGTLTRGAEEAWRRKVQSLDQKLQMSRSIMRKLYYKNVQLEKEVQILKANSSPIDFSQQTAELMRLQGSGTAGPSTASASADGFRPMTAPSSDPSASPITQALQERDRTILQLQQALNASRRRCAVLEAQVGSQPGAAAALGTVGGRSAPLGAPDAQDVRGLREILAQSQLHFQKYKQIRDDYNRLLYKRAGSLQGNKATSQAAKTVVGDMQERLKKEVAEREAEAAIYSARLYESERQMADWYVERRMLEEHIARLNAEISERDRLDQEIETCVCGLFERLRMLEGTNEQLKAALSSAGVSLPADVTASRAGS